MSENSVLKISSLGLVELEGSSVEESENPDGPEVSGDASKITPHDLGSDEDFKSSSSYMTPQDPIVNSFGFTLDEIRLDQDFDGMADVKKIVTTVRVDKPRKDVFFQVRPGKDWSFCTYLLEVTEDHETYILLSQARQFVSELADRTILYTSITRSGDLFLFPVKIHESGGKLNPWLKTRMAAVELAMKGWVRMASNNNGGVYEIYSASGNIPDPVWPADLTLEDILNIAFKDRIIRDRNHPVIMKLRGEI